jgi:hypothetical protein
MEFHMRIRSVCSSRFDLALAGLATAGVLLLSGCAGMSPTVITQAVPASGAIAGHIHGGNQPVSGATVKLYAAGSSGYGSAGTLLATATSQSDGYGSFSFSQVGSGGSGPSGSSYTCPSANSLLYIVATGGNTGGGNNTSAAFLAAVGACGSSANAFIDMNEITTVASVFALAQYINPGSGVGAESIGTSNTTQGATGLKNAFANVANLATIATGTIPTPPQYLGTGSAAGITVTATAEASKITTIADILAACVNTTSGSSTCSDLFNSALPPTSASTTSQPSATFAAAQDTVQAAYYLAVNPGLNGTPGNCSTLAPTAMGCLFNLVGATPPFQTPLAAAPSDWTVGVTYTATGTCGTGGSFLSGPYHSALDAAGDVWFVNGVTSNANLSEISPIGQPLFCGGNLPSGRGVTIDANGNVWASFNGTATNGVMEVPSGTGTPVYWQFTAGGKPYPVTADAFGNVFVSQNDGGGFEYEWVNPDPSHNATPFAATLLNATGVNGIASTTLGFNQVDAQDRVWVTTATVNFLYEFYPTASSQATITGVAVSAGSATFTAVNSFTTGQTVQISGLTSTLGQQLNYGTYTITAATAASFTVNTIVGAGVGVETAGLAQIPATYTVAPQAISEPGYGLGLDSSGYVYQGTTCCGTNNVPTVKYRAIIKWTPGLAGATTNTYSAADVGGINGVRALAVDGASNIWVANEYPSNIGSTLTSGTYALMELTSAGSGTTVTYGTDSPPGVFPPTCSTTAGSNCATGGGYYDSDLSLAYDLEVDSSGNLWVMDSYGYTTSTSGTAIVEMVGAAVPVYTPVSLGMRSGSINAKP